jgi:hypothetical protein
MGMFDTIEVKENIKNGPDAGEYQTKDLGSYLDNYFIKDNRLWLIKRRIEVVPEAERKHPVLGMFRSIEEETVDLCYHGWFEMYGPYTTWKLKFTDGELMQSIFVTHDTDTAPVSGSTAEDCQDDTEEVVAHWKGDGYVPEPDYDDYEG